MGTQNDPRRNFVPRWLPWLLAAAMLAVYVVTLNRWVSLFNLAHVAKISGWLWQPEMFNPLSFLALYPLRWLSEPAIPFALNLFSAVCAALTLGLLARSVAILPHDRTEAQRRREGSDYSFLTLGSAWLPPALAVAFCGLQLTFWEHATNCTGEMFDLLLFAFVVWSLLEYRLDEREGRLYLAALVYGAGMAENWAMVGFLPAFLAAIVWNRGFGFFEMRFLKRMALCGLAGMLFFLLQPLLTVASGEVPASFWQILKISLAPDYNILKSYGYSLTHPGQSAEFLSLLLAYLLPLFLLAIRWKTGFGDASRLGSALASLAFHLVHAVFLGFLIWMSFDSPFSPRQLGGGTPMLTLYFLGALSIGYYSGYFLLIFGKKEGGSRAASRPPPPWQFLNRPVVAAVWLLGVGGTAGLAWRNTPEIQATNGDTLHRYASLVVNNLPRGGGYLLSDDPQRLVLVESALVEDNRAREFVPLDTQSLVVPAYHRFLHRKFPQRWPEIVSATQTNALNPIGLVQVLAMLSRTNDLYYLHPSFGYYFEQFYPEPHGLVYKLKTLPEDTLGPPLPDKNLVAENETFWTQTAAPALAPVEQALAPSSPNAPTGLVGRLLERFHIPLKQAQAGAAVAGAFYSRSLDFWGVELQRAGELDRAARCFSNAIALNPDNEVAKINLQFNATLRAGGTGSVDLSKVNSDQFGRYATWSDVMNANGPFDDPSFCYATGLGFERNMYYGQPWPFTRQAVAQFDRVRQLVPDYLPARLRLGEICIVSRLPDRALEVLRDPLDNPQKFSVAEADETQLSVLAAAAYFQKTNFTRAAELINAEIARHPDDNALLTAAAQAYMAHGMFNEVLEVIDHKLKSSPDDPVWLYGKGLLCIQLKKYNDAIATLDHVLTLQTNNYQALFSRAVANLDSDRLDAARADYARLQQVFANSFQVAYGLGEIAWRRHDTNEAVRNYQIYLANANTNTDEAKSIAERLRELKK